MNNFVDWTLNGVYPDDVTSQVYSFYGRRGVVPNSYSPYPSGIISADKTSVITPDTVNMICYAVNTQSYQWEKSLDGVTYTKMEGETADRISQFYGQVPGVAGSYWYRCICHGFMGDYTTEPVEITVTYHEPTITISSDKTSVITPNVINFSATATYTTSYQWMKDGVDITGAVNATYQASFAYGDAGTYEYSCKAIGLGGTVTSTSITVTVTEPVPTVSISPESATVKQEQTTTLTATATHATSYQWYKYVSEWQIIAGATGTTLTPAAEPLPIVTKYHCVVSGPGGTATSNDATITTEAAAPTVTLGADQTTVPIGTLVRLTATVYPASSTTVIKHWELPEGSIEWKWIEIATGTTAQYTCTTIGTERFMATTTNYGVVVDSNELEITVTSP